MGKCRHFLYLVIAVLLVLTLTLTACAPGPTPTPEKTPASAPTPTPTPAPTPATPAKKINTIDQAVLAVITHLHDLATTPNSKKLAAKYIDSIGDWELSVVSADGQVKYVYDDSQYQGWDVRYYHVLQICWRAESDEYWLSILAPEGDTTEVIWVVNTLEGNVIPLNGNAYRVEAELTK